jgi:hypothetical protein
MPHLSDWKKIIDNIFNMVSKFKTYSNKAMFNVNTHAEDIFVNKLVERFEEIKKTPDLAKFICSDSFTVNGNVFPGIKKIMPQVVEYMKMISSKSLYNWQIIHGDLFFGNMLYDINSDTLKIVDPRGNFGVDGIYGDVRYDLAKLAHSIVGKYDFVVNGLYTIYSQSDSHIEFQIYESKQKHDELVDLFKAKLEQEGFNETEIMMITGTLFLSLIPLHSENPTNQKIFYAIALEILNDTIKRLPNKELE